MPSLEELLRTHSGRDGIIRTLGYACLLSSGLTKGSLSKKFGILSSEFSHCRVISRLLDDWPMLTYSMSYGLGTQEQDYVLRILGVLKNIADQVFYPVEHVTWLAKKQIINIQTDSWEAAGTILWAFSLYCGIARSLRTINIIQKKREKLYGLSDDVCRQENDALMKEQLGHALGILRNVADFVNAISWLPGSFLWAGKLKAWHNGLLGLSSSLLSLACQAIL